MTRLIILRRVAAAAAVLLVPAMAGAQSSPSPYTTGMRYDAVGRVTGTIGPDPDGTGPLAFAAVRNSYDAAGRLIRQEKGELAAWQSEAVAPASWTGFTIQQSLDTVYDALDRKVKESVGSGGTVTTVTQYSYDFGGRLDCTAVRMNPAVFGSLPASACTPGTAGSDGPDRITKNFYDKAGQLIQVREGVGTGIEVADATYSYTPNGKREYVIDANGNRAQLVYDGHDRLSQWVFPSTTRPASYNDTDQTSALGSAGAVNTADYEQYGYDASGNRTSLRKRDGRTISYYYDALNRVVQKSGPLADTSYGYDLRGLQLTATFITGGEGITNTYNGFGELTTSTSNMGGASRTLKYQYDPEGKRVSVTHPDLQMFSYARDGLGRVNNIYEGATATSTAQLIQNGFNSRGLLASMQRSVAPGAFAATFSYDLIGRLASTVNDAAGTANDLTISQSYSPASQIASQTRSNDAYSWTGSVALTRPYTTNGLNQYTVAGPASFTYDANGNLTSDGSSTFTYDVENRLVSASGAKTASLTYDPLGRLWRVTGPTTDTKFLYDGDELAAEYDAANTMIRRYVHSDNADDPVVEYDGTGVGAANRIYLMPDERGSIAGLFYSSGTVIRNSYDEYGIPGAANQGRFQYTGQAWLPELGMYHYKARIYSPTLGRFLQTDPIGYDDQINLYAYVRDDPVNKGDPTGLDDVYHYPNGDRYIVKNVVNRSTVSDQRIISSTSRISGFTSDQSAVVTAVKMSTINIDLTLRTDPILSNSGPLRSNTNEIGGNLITLRPNASDGTVGHEMCHSFGCGDQYAGGIDAAGNRVLTDVPGPTNLMRDAKGMANAQSVDEVAKQSDNFENRHHFCTSGTAIGGDTCE